MSIDVCKLTRDIYNNQIVDSVNDKIKIIPDSVNKIVSGLGTAANSVVDALNMFTEFISNTVNGIISILNMFFPRLGQIMNLYLAYTSPVGFVSLMKLYLIPFIERALPGIEFTKAFQVAGLLLLLPIVGMAFLFYEGLFGLINSLINKAIDKN
jgi:hypothetical protein